MVDNGPQVSTVNCVLLVYGKRVTDMFYIITIMDDMRLLDWMRAWMRPCPAVTGRWCGNLREARPMMCGIYVGWILLTACVDCGHQAVHFVHGCFLCCFRA